LKGIGGGISSGKRHKEQRRQSKIQEQLSKRQLNLQSSQTLAQWRNNSSLKSTRLDFYNDIVNIFKNKGA